MDGERLAWSCDERDRKACRNAHGCHCAEITDLLERVKGKETLVAASLQLIRRLEARNKAQGE